MKIVEGNSATWDHFIKTSAQYMVLSESVFLECASHPIQYFFCEDEGNTLAALACEVKEDRVVRNMDHHPYGGIHFNASLDQASPQVNKIVLDACQCFADFLFERFDEISITNHWDVRDLRAFKSHYDVFARYTSLLDITNPENTEGYARKRIRELTKGEDEKYKFTLKEIDDVGLLDRLHELNFIRQGLERPASEKEPLPRICNAMKKMGRGALLASFVNDEPAVVSFFVYDRSRAYHLFVGTELKFRELGVGTRNFHDSCMVLNRRFGCKELDLLGANSPLRSSYKLSYGGALVPYFGIKTA